MTEKQKKIFEFIRKFHIRHKRMPTINEIANAFGFKSTSTVYEYLHRLTEKGFLKKIRYGIYELSEEYLYQQIPFYGEIAAGEPLPIFEDPVDFIEVPLATDLEDCYALRIHGNSMIDEGIFDKDLIIVKYTETALNGETVVVIIDGDSSTIKKYFKKGKLIELRPANKNMDSIFYEPERIRIVGKVKYLIRNF